MLLFPFLVNAKARPLRRRGGHRGVLIALRELAGFAGLAMWIAGSLAVLAMLPI